MLRVVMPSGATLQGKIIEKSAEADFATQRDVSPLRLRAASSSLERTSRANPMLSAAPSRVEDPLVPRAIFGVLNTLLFFPSGAISPVSGFPKWLRAIALVDPFTYVVHGLKSILLKDGGFVAIRMDLLFLFVFGAATLLIATPLFKRSL